MNDNDRSIRICQANLITLQAARIVMLEAQLERAQKLASALEARLKQAGKVTETKGGAQA